MSTRYVIEGTWAGYSSRQDRVVHRSVHLATEKRLRAWAEANFGITFTDGTRLILSVRDCEPRERVEQMLGYRSLIDDCAFYNVVSVSDLQAARQAMKGAA